MVSTLASLWPIQQLQAALSSASYCAVQMHIICRILTLHLDPSCHRFGHLHCPKDELQQHCKHESRAQRDHDHPAIKKTVTHASSCTVSVQDRLTVVLDLDGTLISSFTPRRAPRLPSDMTSYIVGRGGKLNPGGVFVVERPGLQEFFERLSTTAGDFGTVALAGLSVGAAFDLLHCLCMMHASCQHLCCILAAEMPCWQVNNLVHGDLNSPCCVGLPAEVVLFTAGLEDYAAPICNALDNNYRCGYFRLPNCLLLQADFNVVYEVKHF